MSYNLSGMGCSAGLLAIDLARELLNSRPKSVALVISTENLTQNLYRGNERSMLLQNTLFREFCLFLFEKTWLAPRDLLTPFWPTDVQVVVELQSFCPTNGRFVVIFFTFFLRFKC